MSLPENPITGCKLGGKKAIKLMPKKNPAHPHVNTETIFPFFCRKMLVRGDEMIAKQNTEEEK